MSSVVKFSSQMHDNHALSLIEHFPKHTLAYCAIIVFTLLSIDFLKGCFSRAFTAQNLPLSESSSIVPRRIAITTLLPNRPYLPADGCMKIPHSLLERRGKFYQPDARENTGLWKIYYPERFEIVDTGYIKGFAVTVDDLKSYLFEDGGQVYRPNGTKYDGSLPSYKNIPQLVHPLPMKKAYPELVANEWHQQRR